jgi:hypothetical protein
VLDVVRRLCAHRQHGRSGGRPLPETGVCPMSEQQTIVVTCHVHGTACKLIVTRYLDRLVLDVEGDRCHLLALDARAGRELFGVLGDWLW